MAKRIDRLKKSCINLLTNTLRRGATLNATSFDNYSVNIDSDI